MSCLAYSSDISEACLQFRTSVALRAVMQCPIHQIGTLPSTLIAATCFTGPKADIYHAARVGDLERIKHLVEEEEVDVNRRDRWDSVPLYYACLAGMRAHCQTGMTCCGAM